MPQISIITVTYNAETTIERTLRSVAAQTFTDYEHLIIDGKSSDNTVAIAQQYNTTIVSERDHGLYDAMNKGIRLAKGDFIVFLNAGDKLHSPETLAHLAPLMRPDIAVVYGNTDIVDEQGTYLRPRHLTPPDTLTWQSFQHGMLVCHQAFYLNRSLASQYDLSYRFSADFDWCIRCMKEGESRGMTNAYLRESVADYLSEGMTTANHRASLIERFRIMCRHYGTLRTIINHIRFIFR